MGIRCADRGLARGERARGGVGAGGPLRPLYDSLAQTSEDPMRRNYTARGLWPNTRYAFKVAQTNEVGRSEWSDIAEFMTTPVAPTVSSAVPLAGPRNGGTRVTVRGADLAFGSVYTCKFGETWVPATRTAMEKPMVAAASIVEKWSEEAAATILRRRDAIRDDAARRGVLSGDGDAIESGLRGVVAGLIDEAHVLSLAEDAAAMARDLDERLCCPRDLGAPAAAAIRRLAALYE